MTSEKLEGNITSQRDSSRARGHEFEKIFFRIFYSLGQLCGSTILFRTGTVLASYVIKIHCFHPAPMVDITACLNSARNSRGDSATRKYVVRASAIEYWSTTWSQRDGRAVVVFAHFFSTRTFIR